MWQEHLAWLLCDSLAAVTNFLREPPNKIKPPKMDAAPSTVHRDGAILSGRFFRKKQRAQCNSGIRDGFDKGNVFPSIIMDQRYFRPIALAYKVQENSCVLGGRIIVEAVGPVGIQQAEVNESTFVKNAICPPISFGGCIARQHTNIAGDKVPEGAVNQLPRLAQ